MIDLMRDYGFMICYFTLFFGAITCIVLAGLFLDRRKPLLYGALLLITAWTIISYGMGFLPRMTIPFK